MSGKQKERKDATYPLAVDGHLGVRINTQMSDLRDIPYTLHVRRIAPCAEDTRDACLRVHVVRRDECPGGVACKRDELCGNLLHTL